VAALGAAIHGASGHGLTLKVNSTLRTVKTAYPAFRKWGHYNQAIHGDKVLESVGFLRFPPSGEGERSGNKRADSKENKPFGTP